MRELFVPVESKIGVSREIHTSRTFPLAFPRGHKLCN